MGDATECNSYIYANIRHSVTIRGVIQYNNSFFYGEIQDIELFRSYAVIND